MSRPHRAVALLTSGLLALAACTSPGDPGGSGNASSSATSSATSSASDAASRGDAPKMARDDTRAYEQAVRALGDDYPTIAWGKPLPEDVTEARLQQWLEKGRLPIGEAHGGYFETMTNALVATEDPDVVLLGDSMVQQGIDPQVVERELSTSTGTDVTAFNAASSRARWGVGRMMARYMVRIDKVPDVVVLVLTPRAAESDAYYRSEVRVAPFSSVVEGCWRESAKNWTAEDVDRCQADVNDLTERYRDAGGQVARAEAGRPLQTSSRVDDDSFLRSDGMMIHPSVSEEKARKQAEQRLSDHAPGLPHVDDIAVDHFGDTVRILEDHGAKVVAVSMPYTPSYQEALDSRYPKYNQRRINAAEQITGRNDVPLHTVDHMGDWWGDGDNRDEFHLAPRGAADFTHQLLDDVPGFRDAVEEGLRQ